MKTIAILACLAIASCSAPTDWQGTPNPLDTPATHHIPPPSEGDIGHGWMIR